MTPVDPEIDLAAIQRGSITAPAGFGKTQVIAATVAKHQTRRFLVLTHTNAGVSSLRRRLAKLGVSTTARVETISALALRLVRAFPGEVGWNEDAGIDHSLALTSALSVLERPTILAAFIKTYHALIVDEYQDCTSIQHGLITHLAEHLPTAVLGDPLQAIFDFAEPLVPWHETEAHFPAAGTLSTPQRWVESNPPLGSWLKSIREPLLRGEAAMLPPVAIGVQIRNIDRPPEQGVLLGVVPTNSTTTTAIIIPDSREPRRIGQYARGLKGVGTVQEAVEMPELLTAVTKIMHSPSRAAAVLATIDFASSTTTGVTSPSAVRTLQNHLRERGGPRKTTTRMTQLTANFLATGHAHALGELLSVLCREAKGNVYRPDLLSAMRRALASLGSNPVTELGTAVRKEIDRRRDNDSQAARCRVGSTLRMKGLEYDHVVLVDPARVPSVEHLYVALSRAKQGLLLVVPMGGGLGPWLRT